MKHANEESRMRHRGNAKVTVELTHPDGTVMVLETTGAFDKGLEVVQTPIIKAGRELFPFGVAPDGRRRVSMTEPDTLVAIDLMVAGRLVPREGTDGTLLKMYERVSMKPGDSGPYFDGTNATEPPSHDWKGTDDAASLDAMACTDPSCKYRVHDMATRLRGEQ